MFLDDIQASELHLFTVGTPWCDRPQKLEECADCKSGELRAVYIYIYTYYWYYNMSYIFIELIKYARFFRFLKLDFILGVCHFVSRVSRVNIPFLNYGLAWPPQNLPSLPVLRLAAQEAVWPLGWWVLLTFDQWSSFNISLVGSEMSRACNAVFFHRYSVWFHNNFDKLTSTGAFVHVGSHR